MTSIYLVRPRSQEIYGLLVRQRFILGREVHLRFPTQSAGIIARVALGKLNLGSMSFNVVESAVFLQTPKVGRPSILQIQNVHIYE